MKENREEKALRIMNKKNKDHLFNQIIHKLWEMLGEQKLKAEDHRLKEQFLKCEDAKERIQINRQRRAIRKKRKWIRQGTLAGFFLAVILVVVLLIWGVVSLAKGVTGSGKKPAGSTETVTATGEAETSEETGKETETEAKIKPTEITMSFTGDCILGTDEFFAWDTGFNAYYELYGPEYFMKNVKHVFEADDLTVINMEGTLTEETTRLDKQFAFKGDPEFVKILTSASVEAANMANNHSHDYGEQSFLDTVNTLEQNNIRTFGYDDTVIINIRGVNVGLLGIYELDDHLERIPQLRSDLGKLKAKGADIIVAVMHWSNELVTVPDENQVTLAHLAIDEGADLVVGHHPHVVQGIETYKGKTIAYSLGNFCFGGNTHPKETDTMIFQQKFSVNENREITGTESTVIPCSVSSDPWINNYQPTILEGEEGERVLQLIQDRSDAIISYE